MKKIVILGIATLAGIGLLSTTARAQEMSVEAIVKAHVEALGGLDAIDKIKTIKRSGSLLVKGTGFEVEGTNEEVIAVGEKIYQLWHVENVFTQVTVMNGTAGWYDNSTTGLNKLEGDGIKSRNFLATVSTVASVWREKGNDAIKVLPEETLDGTAYHVLQIAEEEKVKLYLDKDSYLLAHWIAIQGYGETVISYQDYSSYKGVLLPKTITLEFQDRAVPGPTVCVTHYSEMTINEEVDKSLFEKPRS